MTSAKATVPTPKLPLFAGLQTLRLLGRGMAGEVFETRDPQTGKRYVVKRFRPQVARSLDLVRFLREAELMRRLRHPNLMLVLHVEAATPPYYVMPFREGVTLADRLRQGRISVSVAVRAARDACAGLAEAHRARIIHRDVKPANLFLEASGRTVLLDFGLAKDMTGKEALTAEGALLGTPAYMAPEQCRGEPTSSATDVYSLGVSFFELVLGKNPFATSDVVESLRRQLEEMPRRLDALVPARVRPELGELVHRMIAKNPAHRPSLATCLEAFDELGRRYESDARQATRCSARPDIAPVFPES